MNLVCAICAHKPPGDRDIMRATAAVTVMSGLAICEEHIDWISLSDDVEDLLIREMERKQHALERPDR